MGSETFIQTMKTKTYLEGLHEKLVKAVPDFDLKHSFEEIKEIYLIVQAKHFVSGITDHASQYKIMVPFLDVFNHSDRPNTEWRFENKSGLRGYYIYATDDILAGQQLTARYGPGLTNQDLVLRHGFFDSTNSVPISTYVIPYLSSEEDGLLDYKLWAFGDKQKRRLAYETFPKPDFDDQDTVDCLSIIRLVVLDDLDYFFENE